jgi:hypothetical protein
MAPQRKATDATRAATTTGGERIAAAEMRAEPPVNRRRALRLLGTLAMAAAGAAALTTSRPEPVSAALPFEGDSTDDTTAGVEGTNTATPVRYPSPGVLGFSDNGVGVIGGFLPLNTFPVTGKTVGVWGYSTSSAAGVEGDSTAGGPGVYGSSTAPGGFGVQGNGSTFGVYGTSSITGVVGAGTSTGVWGNTTDGTGVLGSSTNGAGVSGTSSALGGAAVSGTHNGSGFGVLGKTASPSFYAILGINSSGGTGIKGGVGVFGSSTSGNGVWGDDAGSGIGVQGSSTSGVGVFGTTNTSLGGAPAIQGTNFGAGGPGVVGFSSAGTGVGGGTATGIGFAGVASTSGNGVQGQTTSGIAVEGIATGASGFSGYFTGGQGMAVNGNFTVNHGFVKSAAVRGKDGTLVRLYCVESPESWFEDFGHGQLTNGSTTVQLEPGFAAVVKTDDYHVFLTPQGESKGWLYVSGKTPTNFTVHEAGGGTSSVAFDYRIVAKRKDVAGVRLEHVDEPPTVHLFTLPELPATPPTPPAAIPSPQRSGS